MPTSSESMNIIVFSHCYFPIPSFKEIKKGSGFPRSLFLFPMCVSKMFSPWLVVGRRVFGVSFCHVNKCKLNNFDSWLDIPWGEGWDLLYLYVERSEVCIVRDKATWTTQSFRVQSHLPPVSQSWSRAHRSASHRRHQVILSGPRPMGRRDVTKGGVYADQWRDYIVSRGLQWAAYYFHDDFHDGSTVRYYQIAKYVAPTKRICQRSYRVH